MHRVLCFSFSVLLSIFFASCALLTTPAIGSAHTLQLTIAPLPVALVRSAALVDHFVLSWFDEQLRHRRRVIPSAVLLRGGGESGVLGKRDGGVGGVRASSVPLASDSRLAISIALNTPTPITLTPVAINGVRFSPAGVVAPLPGAAGSGARHHLAVLRWEDGCAVTTLLRAFPITKGLHGFNFYRYLALVSQQPAHERCWMNDDAIVALLRQGTMRSALIRTRPLHQPDLLLPDGRWLSSNLLQPLITSNGTTSTPLDPLPYGILHFFDPEQRAYLRLSLTMREATVIYQKNM